MGLTQSQIDIIGYPMIQDNVNVKKEQITGGMPSPSSQVEIGDIVQIIGKQVIGKQEK